MKTLSPKRGIEQHQLALVVALVLSLVAACSSTPADDVLSRITGRIKDMIIRGGENVYPRGIEEFLHTNPKVEMVAVFGVPDQRFGEQATAEEMIAFCKGRIAHYKVPRYVKFVDEFPMTASGKLKKFVMREMYAKELEGNHHGPG